MISYNKNADRIYRINAYVKEPEKDAMKLGHYTISDGAGTKKRLSGSGRSRALCG